MIQKKNRKVHLLNYDGMIVCNPRDKEAAHRAEMNDILTDTFKNITCEKCRRKR